jgi:hypothetical protein
MECRSRKRSCPISERRRPPLIGCPFATRNYTPASRFFPMVEYWRTNGWPDLYHPTGDDFECG